MLKSTMETQDIDNTDHKLRLLLQVARGEQDEVEKTLRVHPEYLLFKGEVTDLSGRTFTNITAFQYALWAMDVRYMCKMMIACLPRTSEGEAIKDQLLPQYNALERDGVTYTQRGESHTEKHYNILPLITVLEDYCSKRSKLFWIETVGKLQFDVPAHIAQHYCVLGKTLDAQRNFSDDSFKRTLTVSTQNGPCNWYDERLGTVFAITRGIVASGAGAVIEAPSCQGIYSRRNGKPNFWAGEPYDLGPALDWKALSSLGNVRLADLLNIKLILQKPLQQIDEDAAKEESKWCSVM